MGRVQNRRSDEKLNVTLGQEAIESSCRGNKILIEAIPILKNRNLRSFTISRSQALRTWEQEIYERTPLPLPPFPPFLSTPQVRPTPILRKYESGLILNGCTWNIGQGRGGVAEQCK